MLKILYEDPHLIVAEKPSGVESQSSGGFQPDMVSMIQNHIAAQANQTSGKICTDLSTNWGKLSTKQVEKKGKTGAPYVGVIHRLDKPVQGILVYAKTKETAKALSRLISEGKTEKYYFAVVCGKPVEKEGTFVDYLRKDPKKNESAVVDKTVPGAREADFPTRFWKAAELMEKIFLWWASAWKPAVIIRFGCSFLLMACLFGEITVTIRIFRTESGGEVLPCVRPGWHSYIR